MAVATAEPAAPEAHDDHGPSTGISNTKLAMWVFLGSECLLFGGLISTYLLYKTRRGPDNRAIPTDVFDIPFTSISSFVLLMSSLTMVLALAALTRGDNHGARVWLWRRACLAACSSAVRCMSSPASCVRVSASPTIRLVQRSTP